MPSASEAHIGRLRFVMSGGDSPESSPVSSPLRRKRARTDNASDRAADDESDFAEGNEEGSITGNNENIDPSIVNDPAGTISFSPGILQPRATGGTTDTGRLQQFAHRYSKKLKLTKEQQDRGDDFNARSLSERLYILWAGQQALRNQVDKIVTAQPLYAVSNSLKKSIDKYALAALLSAKISHYKGDIPRIHVEGLLKKYQEHELPRDLERNPADWSKVQSQIQYSLTQLRSKWKKAIAASIKNKDKTKCTNIYKLAQNLATSKNTVTAALCTRVAVMREVYIEKYGHEAAPGHESPQAGEDDDEPGGNADYWFAMDGRLELIRELAGGDKKKISRALKSILKDDRKTYGIFAESEGAEGDQEENDFQQEVDEVVGNEV
ncbi:hypothetical protein GLOTRDRAFT_96416 [Gloeophyllum trabeum ATCC 11539]|uniref:Uncharacterized protein n=1 Tax=Gloeophyllum trabeum (strain ATCC 11539 / FP-39264 / Madison 617) TaxID=670483 RepID=S7PTT3_GLOTA|nr:uncharacterized protein GLOTRDRAFT_96416 [Gloeophyllum trabeum ATCC 11539]EPQ51211.1 hypothetical protein GLOTRDRAFT_96416 [Gloeophyllum trabeum ATCC 11539]